VGNPNGLNCTKYAEKRGFLFSGLLEQKYIFTKGVSDVLDIAIIKNVTK
jgi:hypothetical protein